MDNECNLNYENTYKLVDLFLIDFFKRTMEMDCTIVNNKYHCLSSYSNFTTKSIN